MYSIVIPAYNEEKRLLSTIKDLHFNLTCQEIDYEIIIVNDGSTDGTVNIANQTINQKTINLPVNMGKGAAIREGLKQANGDIIIVVDADLPTNPEEMIRLCYFLRQYDIVIGSRRMKNSKVNRSEFKKAVSWTFSFLTRLITGLNYQDTQCGVKAFSRTAVNKILPLVNENRYLIDIDILYAAKHTGCVVHEEGIVWNDKAGSKVSLARDSFRMAIGLWRLRKKYQSVEIVPTLKPAIGHTRKGLTWTEL